MATSGQVDAIAQVFASHGAPKRFAAGEALLQSGRPAQRVVCITSGMVRIVLSSADGRESMLSVRGPGDMVGELAVILDQPHSASAIAIVDTEALTMAPGLFQQLLDDDDPRLSRAVLALTAERLLRASAHRIQTATSDSVVRVASILVELGATIGVGQPPAPGVTIEFSQQDLANFAGMSRDSVVRALGRLRTGGWIETKRRYIVIHDMGALARFASLDTAS